MPAPNRVITQFFFDNAHYLRFLEAARARGIWAPIIPGIVPIHNFKQVAGFAGRCGATMPAWLARRFDGLDNDPPTTHLVAAAVAAEQVMDLVDQGIRQFHFYTLNRADLVYAICHLLGLRPEPVRRQGGRQRMTREQRIAALKEAAAKRILIMDGAMGTMIQRYKFDEAAYRGARFADHARSVKGNNDLLVLTQPEAIARDSRRLSGGRRRYRLHQLLQLPAHLARRLRHGGPGLRAQRGRREAGARGCRRGGAARRRTGRASSPAPWGRPTAPPRSRPTSTTRASAASPSTSWCEAYGEQARGLIEGGADMLLIETVFDTLNAKAAGFAALAGVRRDWAWSCR